MNDPVNSSDPSGLDSLGDEGDTPDDYNYCLDCWGHEVIRLEGRAPPTGTSSIFGQAWGLFRENVWIPVVDPWSELDQGRTVKVGAAIALAATTGGASLGVQIGIGLVAADQVSSGILGTESLVYQAGTAVCGGNESCGTVAEVGATLGPSIPSLTRPALAKTTKAARAPILVDTDLLIRAYGGNQAALSEIRAGTTYVTPLNRTEFLNVQESLARGRFLQGEGIITFQSPGKWFLTESGPQNWNVIDEVIQGGHGPVDAIFGAVSVTSQ